MWRSGPRCPMERAKRKAAARIVLRIRVRVARRLRNTSDSGWCAGRRSRSRSWETRDPLSFRATRGICFSQELRKSRFLTPFKRRTAFGMTSFFPPGCSGEAEPRWTTEKRGEDADEDADIDDIGLISRALCVWRPTDERRHRISQEGVRQQNRGTIVLSLVRAARLRRQQEISAAALAARRRGPGQRHRETTEPRQPDRHPFLGRQRRATELPHV